VRLINTKYKAVIFDLFGTLVDNFSRAEYESVLAEMAQVVGVPPAEFQRIWLESFQERNTGVHPNPQYTIKYICQRLGITATEAQVEKAARVRLDYTLRSLSPRPNSVATIKKLNSLGYKTGLVSDCTGDIPMVWEKTPFANLFYAAIFSCEIGIKKPDLRIFYIAADRLGVRPQDCLYIGDGGSGELSGAQETGMSPVLLRDPGESYDMISLEREDSWNGPRIAYLREVLNLVK
jgi:putative hydrolase of the HAD superfamily